MDNLFFCHACLEDKNEQELSPDSRYCQWCYDFLLKEAEILPSNKCPAWIPKPQRSPVEAKNKPRSQYQVSRVGYGIMSPLEHQKSVVDIIRPAVTSRASGKRGPKHRQLPEDLIWRLAGEGYGSKAIATRLKEQGIKVSYKTIQRVLSGERCFWLKYCFWVKMLLISSLFPKESFVIMGILALSG